MTVDVSHTDAEAVVRAFAVFQFYLSEHCFIALGGEDGADEQTLVPEGQIVCGHGEFAGGKHPAEAFFGCDAQGAEGMAVVGRGVVGTELGLVGVPRAGHAQRAENVFGDELEVGFAGNFLNDAAGDDEVGVGVLPLGAGLKVERLFGPGVEDLLGGSGSAHGDHDVVLGPVVLIAGGVGEDLADGDFVAAGEAGDVLTDRVINR